MFSPLWAMLLVLHAMELRKLDDAEIRKTTIPQGCRRFMYDDLKSEWWPLAGEIDDIKSMSGKGHTRSWAKDGLQQSRCHRWDLLGVEVDESLRSSHQLGRNRWSYEVIDYYSVVVKFFQRKLFWTCAKLELNWHKCLFILWIEPSITCKIFNFSFDKWPNLSFHILASIDAKFDLA